MTKKKVIYNFHPGVGGGINQHMSKERRRAKQARHRANAAKRFTASQDKRRK